MSYSHLSANERYVIDHLLHMKLSFREIGNRLARHHTTIAREVHRVRPPLEGHVYIDGKGMRRYRNLKDRPQHHRRRSHAPLWRYVTHNVNAGVKLHQLAGAKMHHRASREGPRSGAFS